MDHYRHYSEKKTKGCSQTYFLLHHEAFHFSFKIISLLFHVLRLDCFIMVSNKDSLKIVISGFIFATLYAGLQLKNHMFFMHKFGGMRALDNFNLK